MALEAGEHATWNIALDTHAQSVSYIFLFIPGSLL